MQGEGFSLTLQTIAWLTSRYVRGETSGGRSPNTAPRPTNAAEGEPWDTDGLLRHQMFQITNSFSFLPFERLQKVFMKREVT